MSDGFLCVSDVGLVLTDARGRTVYCSPAVRQILTYPDSSPAGVGTLLQQKGMGRPVRPPGTSAQPSEVSSGRRRYRCRTLRLPSRQQGGAPLTALVLERGVRPDVTRRALAQSFRFTPRERQVTELLLQGLTNKEIAQRLGVKANTVKMFQKLIMAKMGVPNRAGILNMLSPWP